MIRTNLATRPFYNTRAVHAWLLAVAVIVLAATVFNVSEIVKYSRSGTELATRASQDEGRAAELRASAARLRATVDARQLSLAATDARQANELIDRRTFSWTELLNLFEMTLPDNVRLAAVRPKIDPKRGIVLQINVVAASVDDISQLMENLENTGAFKSLIPPDDRVNETGQVEAAIETVYVPQGAKPESKGGRQP